MNKISFLDELLKLGGATRVVKVAYQGAADSSEAPQGMTGSGSVPESIRVAPHEASTRLPKTSHLPSQIKPGALGGVTQAKDPISKHRFNRAWRDSG